MQEKIPQEYAREMQAQAAALGEATEGEVSEVAQFADAMLALEECTCKPDCVTVCPACRAYLEAKDPVF